jgi:hypothetical protein
MSILELKQRVSRLSQRERRELQSYLIRLKHDTPAAKRATAQTIREMRKGKFTTIVSVRSGTSYPDSEELVDSGAWKRSRPS